MQATQQICCAPRESGTTSRARPARTNAGFRRVLSVAISALFAALAATSVPASAAHAQCPSGWIAAASAGSLCGTTEQTTVGGSTTTVSVFRGIPYAKPPVASLRWQPPSAPDKWQGVRAATTFGSKCMQDSAVANPVKKDSSVVVGSEDCLYLNVWTPGTARPSSPVPVMVFIHGGAFVLGTGSSPLYDGAYLAARGGVVVVTLNYRLGPFGFLSGGLRNLQGNQGIKDQQLALQWVQQNIAAFGGDPSQVTLFGESAGAMSVGLHLFSISGSVPLFRAAIMESNPMGVKYRSRATAVANGVSFLAELCKADKAACTDATAASAATVMQVAKKVYGGIPETLARLEEYGLTEALPWTPVLDGSFITRQPYFAYASTQQAKPLIFGMNHDEGVIFAAQAEYMDKSFGPDAYGALLHRVFDGATNDSSNFKRIVNSPGQAPYTYRAAGHASVAGMNPAPSALAMLITDFAFNCGNLLAADSAAATKVTPASKQGAPIFGYRFEQPPFFDLYAGPPQCEPGSASNVCHAYELPYVFHTLAVASATTHDQPTAGDVALADTMAAAWTNFAKNPWSSTGPLPGWTTYPASSHGLYVLNGSVNGPMEGGLEQSASCSSLWYTLPPFNGATPKSDATRTVSSRGRASGTHRTSATAHRH